MFPVIVNLAKFQKVREFSSFSEDFARLSELQIPYREYCFGREKKEDLVAGFHEAIRDPEVDLIWLACGGLTTIETLPLIDWELIQRSGKSFLGFSDFTHLAWRLVQIGSLTYYGLCFKGIKKYFPEIENLGYFKEFLASGKVASYQYEVLQGKVADLNQEKIIGGHLSVTAFMLANHYVDLSDRYLFIEYHYVPGESLPDLGYWIEQLNYVIRENKPKGFIIGRSMFYELDGAIMDVKKVTDCFVEHLSHHGLPMAYLDHFRQIVKFS